MYGFYSRIHDTVVIEKLEDARALVERRRGMEISNPKLLEFLLDSFLRVERGQKTTLNPTDNEEVEAIMNDFQLLKMLVERYKNLKIHILFYNMLLMYTQKEQIEKFFKGEQA
jgi:hypothetical protein